MKLRGSYLRNYKNYFHSRRYYSHIRAVFVNHERILHSRERLFVSTSSHGGTLILTRLKWTDSSFATSHVPPDNQTQSLTATSESRDYELRETISIRRTRVFTTQTKRKVQKWLHKFNNTWNQDYNYKQIGLRSHHRKGKRSSKTAQESTSATTSNAKFWFILKLFHSQFFQQDNCNNKRGSTSSGTLF